MRMVLKWVALIAVIFGFALFVIGPNNIFCPLTLFMAGVVLHIVVGKLSMRSKGD